MSCCQLKPQQEVERYHGWLRRVPSVRKRDGSAVKTIRRRPVLGLFKIPVLPGHPWGVIIGVPLPAKGPSLMPNRKKRLPSDGQGDQTARFADCNVPIA